MPPGHCIRFAPGCTNPCPRISLKSVQKSPDRGDDDHQKPRGRGPLFGGKTVILFGGYDKEAMRRWQERVRAAKDTGVDHNSIGRDKGDEVGIHSDGRIIDPKDSAAPDNAAD